MSEDLRDWRDLVPAFENRFGYRRTNRPTGLKGTNFMTPEVLGILLDADGTPVEISTGTGMTGNRIFGMTWPNDDHDRTDGRNRLCHTFNEIEDALDGEGWEQ